MTSVCINYVRVFETLDIINCDNLKLRLQTYWTYDQNGIDSVDIILVYNEAVWRDSINRRTLEEKAKDLDLECNDYFDSLEYAMVSPWGPKNDILNFKDGVLSWQKILTSGAYISFGDFRMNKIEDSSCLADYISSLLDNYHSLQENFIQELKSEKYSNKEWKCFKEIDKETIGLKIEMQTTMHAKLALVVKETERQLHDVSE